MNIPEQVELLPCPFCGGEAELISPTETDHWAQVNCKMCGCRGTEYPAAIEHAVAAWNKRTLPLVRVERPQGWRCTLTRGELLALWKREPDPLRAVAEILQNIEPALPAQSGSGVREDVAREPMKVALTVLCAARAGQSWHENMMKDFDAAIYGLRVALEVSKPAGQSVEGELRKALEPFIRFYDDIRFNLRKQPRPTQTAIDQNGERYACLTWAHFYALKAALFADPASPQPREEE